MSEKMPFLWPTSEERARWRKDAEWVFAQHQALGVPLSDSMRETLRAVVRLSDSLGQAEKERDEARVEAKRLREAQRDALCGEREACAANCRTIHDAVMAAGDDVAAAVALDCENSIRGRPAL